MSWGSLLLAGAPKAIGQIGSFITAGLEAKTQKRWQAYNNALVRLQNAQNQNAITTNEGMIIERSAEQEYAIRKSEYMTKASTEVSAAASGTTGRSVNAVLFDVGRNAAEASRKREQDLQYQLLGTQQQRESSNMQTEMQQDYTRIPKPSTADLALGLTATAVSTWDSEGRPKLSTLFGQRLPSRGPTIPSRPIDGVRNKL